MRRRHLIALCALRVVLFSARGQGTAFTYQGRLNDGNAPAKGVYDLAFTLFATDSAGAAVGGSITNMGVGVQNGYFVTSLDFGADVFSGASRWLEISVRTNGGAAFTTLNPRQAITPTPYALYAPSAGAAATAASANSVAPGGSVPLSALLGAVLTNGQAGVQISGTFRGDGSGLVNLPSLATNVIEANTDVGLPSTTLIALSGQQNAVQIFTGGIDAPFSGAANFNNNATEPWFQITIATNGTILNTPIRLSRWNGRIINLAPNTSVAVGSIDGRAIQLLPVIYPATMAYPGGSTNLVTPDKFACPDVWMPENAHVVFPSNYAAITLVSTPQRERLVFYRFSDGSIWTHPVWTIIPTNGNRTIFCPLRQMAFATADGAPIQVITYPQTFTGGAAHGELAVLFPGTFGNTWYCTNVAQFDQAISNAVSGDLISLADGVYALDETNANQIQHTVFAANENAGYRGMEGITIASASGNPSACVLAANSANANNWFLDGSGMRTYAYFKGLTFDFANTQYSEMLVAGGYWRFGACRFINYPSAGSGESVEMQDTATAPIFADFVECASLNSGRDCWSGTGKNTPGTDTNSLVRLMNCTARTSGTNNNDQLLTTHGGLPLQVFGGVFSDSVEPIGNENVTNYINLFGATVTGGPRETQTWQDFNAWACWFQVNSAEFVQASNAYLSFCRVTVTNYSSSSELYSDQSDNFVGHNIINSTAAAGRCFFDYDAQNTNMIGNIVLNFNEAARLVNAGPQWLIGNTFVNDNTAINGNDNNLPYYLTNNCMSNTATGVASGPSQEGGSGYNLFKGIMSPNFTPGPGDAIDADASLDQQWFPVSGGNCDTNYGYRGVGYVGDSDPWGLVWIYSTNAVSRGARTIPRVYGNAVLLPDAY